MNFLTFIRDEKGQSNDLTTARVQPLCKKHIINICCYDGLKVCPRNITGRNITLFVYKNHFCSIWKSNGISFNKAMEELKTNFKVVDIILSDKHGKGINKLEYKPKKVSEKVVYVIEAFKSDRFVPYAICIYRLSKFSSKFH